MSATVLAVHNDIAFLLALAIQLEDRHIGLIPAPSVKNAEQLLKELRLQPDLLIVNCRIRGVCAFAAQSLKRWPSLKVVAIVSEGHQCLKCKDLLVTTVGDSSSPMVDRWVGLVRTLMQQEHIATQ